MAEAKQRRLTIAGTENPAVLGAARTRNNGRYNGNGREWRTPPELFAALNREFAFTLDAAATAENALCPMFFTEEQDGLAQKWGRHRVFLNPPYGREVYAWTRKAREAAASGAVVVALLPASTDLAWWHDDVLGGGAEVRFIRGRVRFGTDGPFRASGFFASVIAIWRPRSVVQPPIRTGVAEERARDAARVRRDERWRYLNQEERALLRWCRRGGFRRPMEGEPLSAYVAAYVAEVVCRKLVEGQR